MALTATMMRFELELSDVDRGLYTTIDLRAAQHPSESDAYLVTRVLAMALEYREDLSFGRGISTPDDPGLSAPNDMGGHALWIEIGQPSVAKLHKVTKLADLEPREVLLAKMAGAMKAPLSKAVYMANAPLAQAARVFGALRDKQESADSADAA